MQNFQPQSNEFKRPADRRFLSREYGDAAGLRGSPNYAGMPVNAGVRSMKQEVLQLEEAIPWTMVRRNWRNKRSMWRRQVKQTELVADFAARLKELRLALLADDTNFMGCGPAWRNTLETCIQGRGTASNLLSVWDELRSTIRSWLSCPSAVLGPTGGSFATTSGPPPSSASAGRAVLALQAALKHDGTEALLQTPLESITGYDGYSLHAVRQAIDAEKRIVNSRLAALQGVGGTLASENINGAVVSYFSSIAAGWGDSDFDSGAETEMDEGSDATDLDSDFDA